MKPAGLQLRLIRFSLAWTVACLLSPLPALSQESPEFSSSAALTLEECYALARAHSETLAIQQELIEETEGRFLQALSSALPSVHFELSEKRQDGNNASSFSLKEIPERKITFSQPLFSGFKEFAAIAGSKAERRERQNQKHRAEQLLFLDVARAFHLLRQQREDLGALEITRVTLLERLTELEERERLGRSRLSEVASAEAQLARVEASIELIRRQERTARHLLEFLTGVEPIDGIADSSPSFLMPPDESTYLDMAGSRADVRAVYEAWQKSRMEVVIARSKVWPTIDLEGTYYTKRIGASSGVDWDATISVSLPLFQGGEAVGGIQTASSRARQKELEFLRLKRQARLEIRDAWAEFDSAWNRSAALEKASNASERSFLLQTEEYRRNLVNNLDVLQALQALQDTRREWITAQQETKRLYWQLRVTTGDIP